MRQTGHRWLKRFPVEEKGKQRKYIRAAREILKLEPAATDQNFMAWPAVFYRDWVRGLQEHLENIHGKPWQDVLFPVSLLSEYCLYGVYVDEVLKPSGIDYIERPLHLGVFTKDMLEGILDEAMETLRRHQNDDIHSDALRPICMLVQSNLGLSVEDYISRVEPLLQNAQSSG